MPPDPHPTYETLVIRCADLRETTRCAQEHAMQLRSELDYVTRNLLLVSACAVCLFVLAVVGWIV